MPAARSVATSQMIDAVAKHHGQKTYQTPVGFKYIGQLIREDKIALGGEESAGLTIRGHVPEKDGILACLLVAEMLAARGGSIEEQVEEIFKKVGREFWPVRENMHLSDEQKANAIKRVAIDASTLLGRKIVSVDRTDGAKFVFEDGSWMLLRLSGTEPLAEIVRRSRQPGCFDEADQRSEKLGFTRIRIRWRLAANSLKVAERHGRVLLGLFVALLFVHDIFGAHGYLSMRAHPGRHQESRSEIRTLNKENAALEQAVKDLKTDPRAIEKIAREELILARPGEIIIKIPQSQLLPQALATKP